MSVKYYRVLKDTPLLRAGAIISDVETTRGYTAISDVWDSIEGLEGYWEGVYLVENSPEWFERVYETSFLGKVAYHTKDKAREIAAKAFKS